MIKRVHENVIAHLPDQKEQELLKLVRGAPVLKRQAYGQARFDVLRKQIPHAPDKVSLAHPLGLH
ncbi:hypothetical protein KDH_66660 [Dictyobacter sp. S3.2.2.5]|uniref:Uncharacterized protein n=1 Tax=Dictyobacter halimunensis TaxID=3026934 RepID=A0ABQ6G3M8_9CHLR|nr:hypothetical protein KDH_66660 [Dictyobacter sp. S3.2.2.5]